MESRRKIPSTYATPRPTSPQETTPALSSTKHLPRRARSTCSCHLGFELTETAAVTNLAHAFADGIRPYGCSLALDDFGVGSCCYLKHLPCQYLKIDGEFIRTLAHSPEDQVFVRAMVELARGLGKQTIAEFVEDQATLDLITELGVEFAQGYFIGRPAHSLIPAVRRSPTRADQLLSTPPAAQVHSASSTPRAAHPHAGPRPTLRDERRPERTGGHLPSMSFIDRILRQPAA